MSNELENKLADLQAALDAQRSLLCISVARSADAVGIAKEFHDQIETLVDGGYLFMPASERSIARQFRATSALLKQLTHDIRKRVQEE